MTSVDPKYVRNPPLAMTEMLEDLFRKPRGVAAVPFNRLVTDYSLFFSTEPSSLRVLERELVLCTEPASPFTT